MNRCSELTWLSFQSEFPVFKLKCLQIFQHSQVIMSLSMASLPILLICTHTISVPYLGAYQSPTEVLWSESSGNVISMYGASGPLSIWDFEGVPVIQETWYLRGCYLSVCGGRLRIEKRRFEICGHLYTCCVAFSGDESSYFVWIGYSTFCGSILERLGFGASDTGYRRRSPAMHQSRIVSWLRVKSRS